MTYQELQDAINANIGNGDALIELLTSENVATITRCLNKVYPAVFQNSRRPNEFLAEYLQLRTDLTAAANYTAVITSYTPANVLVATYGVEYQVVHSIYEDRFRALGFADPAAQATAQLAVVMNDKNNSLNVENLTLC